MRPDLDHRGADFDARNDFSRNGASRDPRRCFARGRTPAAAIIADAVFGVIDVIGMAGTIGVFDLAIVLRALVGILDQQRNRRPGGKLCAGVVHHDPGQDFHRVGLLPLGSEAGLAGAAQVEKGLDFRRLQRNSRRTAVDHAAERGAVAFAEGGDAE